MSNNCNNYFIVTVLSLLFIIIINIMIKRAHLYKFTHKHTQQHTHAIHDWLRWQLINIFYFKLQIFSSFVGFCWFGWIFFGEIFVETVKYRGKIARLTLQNTCTQLILQKIFQYSNTAISLFIIVVLFYFFFSLFYSSSLLHITHIDSGSYCTCCVYK